MEKLELKIKVWISSLPPVRHLFIEAYEYMDRNPNTIIVITDNYEKNENRIKTLEKKPGIYVVS